jgi:hypothetical protein
MLKKNSKRTLITRKLFCALLLSSFIIMISCDDDNNDVDDSESNVATLVPEEFCQSECQRKMDAGCTNMPPTYENDCYGICIDRYSYHSECTNELKALDYCVQTTVSYTCGENNVIQITPTGTCQNEGIDCMNCTEDLIYCFF